MDTSAYTHPHRLVVIGEIGDRKAIRIREVLGLSRVAREHNVRESWSANVASTVGGH